MKVLAYKIWHGPLNTFLPTRQGYNTKTKQVQGQFTPVASPVDMNFGAFSLLGSF